MFIPIVLLIACIVAIIIALVLISRIVHAIANKNAATAKRLCNKLLLAIICGAVTFSTYTVFDILKTEPDVSSWMIFLKLCGCIGPFIIGGGVAIYMFNKAIKEIH